jgi:hypothetical protein
MGTEAGASAASASAPAALGRRSANDTVSSEKRRRERGRSATWPPRTRRTASAEVSKAAADDFVAGEGERG